MFEEAEASAIILVRSIGLSTVKKCISTENYNLFLCARCNIDPFCFQSAEDLLWHADPQADRSDNERTWQDSLQGRQASLGNHRLRSMFKTVKFSVMIFTLCDIYFEFHLSIDACEIL